MCDGNKIDLENLKGTFDSEYAREPTKDFLEDPFEYTNQVAKRRFGQSSRIKKTLAGKLGLSERRIYRRLATLRNLGFTSCGGLKS